MESNLSGLKPTPLWKYFAEFLKIPHGSGNEKALGDYIVQQAERLKLDWKRDDIGNVVVSKQASPGYEESEGIILQGHLDMVCEKNSDVAHDFTRDPIQAEIKGAWVQAQGTTLGADNGIGNAAALAVMEDENLAHPPLEFLFTVDEETGLTGASRIQPGFLKGTRLLNLDSEDEGEFTIGCAGGADTQILFPLERTSGENGNHYVLKIFGFQGGHSGVDIHIGRGNAIKLIARALWQIGKSVNFQLAGIEGGNLRNAIPREAWAHIILKASEKEGFSAAAASVFAKIKDEYKAVDPDANMSLQESDEEIETVLTPKSQRLLINFLFTLLHGVVAMHPEIAGLVETSTNLAVVHTKEDKAEIICSTRSSTASALEATRHTIAALSDLVGAEAVLETGYPGWKPNLQSPLLKSLKEVYSKLFGKEANVSAIHAGLECGIIGEKFPGMDMISFGPTIKNPHSPSEKVHIESVAKFWEFLTTLMAELK